MQNQGRSGAGHVPFVAFGFVIAPPRAWNKHQKNAHYAAGTRSGTSITAKLYDKST